MAHGAEGLKWQNQLPDGLKIPNSLKTSYNFHTLSLNVHNYMKAFYYKLCDKDIPLEGYSIYILTTDAIEVDLRSVIAIVKSMKQHSKKQRKKVARFILENTEKEQLCLSI